VTVPPTETMRAVAGTTGAALPVSAALVVPVPDRREEAARGVAVDGLFDGVPRDRGRVHSISR